MIVWLSAISAHAGTWLLEERLVSEVKPPLSRWTQAISESRWVVEWTPGDATMTATLCAITSEPVMGAQSVFPKVDFSRERAVQFDGTTFGMGPTVEVMGDSDDDGDGNPGISVQISHPRIGSGEAYVRQQARMAWSGQQQPDGRITGTLTYEPVQELLGATTWWLKFGTNLRSAVGSTFELVPMPEATDCAGVAR